MRAAMSILHLLAGASRGGALHRGRFTAGAGCTLKVDLEGKVQWLRQHKWNPPRRFDRSWAMRGHPQPIVRAGRIYVTHPGTTEVECLELQSGKQIWRRTFDDPLAITRGLHGLVVATGRAIHCLNFENGKLVWMNNTPLVSPGHLVASGSNESASWLHYGCSSEHADSHNVASGDTTDSDEDGHIASASDCSDGGYDTKKHRLAHDGTAGADGGGGNRMRVANLINTMHHK